MGRTDKVLITGLLLLNLFNWVTDFEVRFQIPNIIKYILSLSVISILIYYRLTHPGRPEPGNFFYPVVLLFILWSVFLLVVALLKLDGLFYIQRMFAQPYFFLPYLLPVILLYTKFDLSFFSRLFFFAFILLVPTILVQLIVIVAGLSREAWHDQVSYIGLFSIGTAFLFMTSHIVRRRYTSYLVILYFVIMLIMYAFYGRRGMIVEYGLMFISLIVIRIKSPFVTAQSRMVTYILLLCLLLMIPYFVHSYRSSYAFERGGINREAFQVSRGRVIEDFVNDFNTFGGWITGRGLDGTVYRQINQEEESANIIENGFLTLILKGGIILMVLFVITLLRAAWLGFFRSSNDLARAMGILLFLHVVMMTYFKLPSYTGEYVLIWIFAAACFNPEVRSLHNEEVEREFNKLFIKEI